MSHDLLRQLRDALADLYEVARVEDPSYFAVVNAAEALAAADAALAVPEPTDDQIVAFARTLGWQTEYSEVRDNAIELVRAARAWQPAPSGREGE